MGQLTGIAHVGVAIVAAQLLTGLLFVVLARRLSTEQFGVTVAVYSGTLAIAGLADFGSSVQWTRELAQNRGLNEFRGWLIRRTLFLAPVFVLVSLAISTFAPDLGTVVSLGLATQVVSYPLAQGAVAAVRVLRSPVYASWLIACGNAVPMSAALVAPANYVLEVAVVGIALSWVLTSLFALISTSASLGPQRTFPWRRNPWSGSVPFGVASVGAIAAGFHLVLIDAMAGPIQAALAGAVVRWVAPVRLLPTAFTTHLFPALAAAPDNRTAIRIMRPLGVMLFCGVIAVGAIVTLAPLLVNNVLGPGFAGATPILRLYALGALPVLVAQPLHSLLQARGREQYVARVTVVASLIGLLLVAAAARLIGAYAGPLVAIVYGLFVGGALIRAASELADHGSGVARMSAFFSAVMGRRG